MIAVDTNILIYAHRRDSAWHVAASHTVRTLAEGAAPWAIPWPCVHEFLAIVTKSGAFSFPTPMHLALNQVELWRESQRLNLLAEPDVYWPRLKAVVQQSQAVGAMVHDARIVALCLEHGVEELWTADRDFSRFKGLRIRNPLVTQAPR